MLRAAGHEVLQHYTHSDSVRGRGLRREIRTSVLIPWNPRARNEIHRLIETHAPDIMHVHNVFPLLSPAIFSAAEKSSTVCGEHLA